MINELYSLTNALDAAGILAKTWHRKYKPIPKNTPCVRILISNGEVKELSFVNATLCGEIRKYGSNQGTYPAMNLAPLYRVSDVEIKEAISGLKPEEIDENKLQEIRSWCREDNWGVKFQSKYKISMVNTAEELLALLPAYEPLRILAEESGAFQDPQRLHRALEEAAFKMLRNKKELFLALQVLFYMEKPNVAAENDYGALSVALETPRLIEMGIPAVSGQFVAELNNALLSAASAGSGGSAGQERDAFGMPYSPVGEPMPDVKLAAGFNATLRTMFRGNPCQNRYNRIEDASYPLSPVLRDKLSACLTWLGDETRRNLTWINTDKDEAMFVYPGKLPQRAVSFTRMFRPPKENKKSFEAESQQFLKELRQGRDADTDSQAKHIRIFILRKLDKARTKVVYTCQTDPAELEKRSEEWTVGTKNLPPFSFGQISTPFPLDTADILNRFWKQDGSLITDKFKPIPKYHGMELLLEDKLDTTADLHLLSEKGFAIGAFLGNKLAKKDFDDAIWLKIKDLLALIGLLLYRRGLGKELYMDSLPYLYGQLLKISDALHALYCTVVREGNLPTQLAGSGVYQMAAEAPVRTLSLLGQRMNPYIAWAKTYRRKNVREAGKESWRAGWLLSLYEKTVDKLAAAWKPETRFNDEEKALLFIGYLAGYPKKEDAGEDTDDTEA